jgi:hypothetical protein
MDYEYKYVEAKINDAHLTVSNEAGGVIEERIKSARNSIKIISPYLGEDMVFLLAKKFLNGKNVKIISSDAWSIFNSDNSEVLKTIIKQERVLVEDNDKKRNSFMKIVLEIVICMMAYWSILYAIDYNRIERYK